ncbi:aminodeoxyfutalosine synthase [Verrucomicrobium sp. GAS474]|uniref:aminofutalosine synthase MqnE n=1 Tax=Verrucomicrobium sp. GAS474 TaxID=1882831 RepID=UPI00087C8385|nr:aminofutalosine synthase MqnE [Verrucomicrobium sp. GAS474]SDU28612.1 aminodeoxyfutalosine synthase [Verrucomicrobium sp. GAS474]
METLLNRTFEKSGLSSIAEKVFAGERIDEADALRLYESPDLNAVGLLANHVRERLNGNVTTYILNRYLNYSNVCILSCQFCAFYRRGGQEGAFELSVEEIVGKAKEAHAQGLTEIHSVGGLHPKLPFSFYLEMIREIKKACPGLRVKAFTAVEIRHLAERIAKKPIRETLQLLLEAGLDSLTGGGAEIFDPEIRDKICRGKEDAEEWLDVHRQWHRLGQQSTCTMLYGHLEEPRHRVDHLRRLRNLQDETNGFTALIPFAYEPENNKLSASLRRVGGSVDLRNIAVARIYLDNIPHLTAYWVSMGMSIAQIAQSYGADDLHGTIREELIFHMAGSKTPQEQTVARMEKAIREAGRVPAQRDTFYRVAAPATA